MCFCCVRFCFFYTKPRDWLGECLRSDLFLCQVGPHLLDLILSSSFDCVLIIGNIRDATSFMLHSFLCERKKVPLIFCSPSFEDLSMPTVRCMVKFFPRVL